MDDGVAGKGGGVVFSVLERESAELCRRDGAIVESGMRFGCFSVRSLRAWWSVLMVQWSTQFGCAEREKETD